VRAAAGAKAIDTSNERENNRENEENERVLVLCGAVLSMQ
jgi:hypothetical protein